MLTCAFSSQLFALFLVLLREPLHLHWLHKVELHLTKALSAEVFRLAFQFCFYLNTGPLMLWCGVHRFGGHGHQRQVETRMADCSSVAAGRLSLTTSLCVRGRGGCCYLPMSFCCLFSQATGPFLQFGAVGALTLLSPIIFKGFHAAKAKCRSLLAISCIFSTVMPQYGCCFCWNKIWMESACYVYISAGKVICRVLPIQVYSMLTNDKHLLFSLF